MTVCATMIVRNEQAVLGRCLNSLRELVDCAVIVDTGSTDDTLNIINQFRDFPIYLHSRPWVNFGHNRTEAIDMARPHGDYLLMLDADQTVEGAIPELTADSYSPMIHSGDLAWRNQTLVRASLSWRFFGVTHEYITCPDAKKNQNIDTFRVIEHADGGGRPVGTQPRWELDAAALEAELIRDPTDSRNVFYLARSYEDLAQTRPQDAKAKHWRDQALKRYKQRVPMPGNDAESYYSMYRMGAMRMIDDAAGLPFLLAAWNKFPHRWEPIRAACLWLNVNRMHHACYALAKQAMTIQPLPDQQFAEPDVYRYLLGFDLSVAASQIGDLIGAIRICEELLAKELPDVARKTIASNLENIRGKVRVAV